MVRIVAIVFFAALTALTARIAIPLPFTPVPITLQVLTVLLAGLVLGAKDGAASQVVYLATIAAGVPLDAGGLGALVWLKPTAGYLIGFIPGAFVAGYLAEQGLGRNRVLRFVAGLAGVAVIYLCGVAWLTLGFLGGNWTQGWTQGVAPFIGVDLAKALIASGVAESARVWLKK
ncbi:MAG: biotin transporter BioY [Chloroflexi bacterium]|nr:biotin transporter BioY [Chloroflexota bacterium]